MNYQYFYLDYSIETINNQKYLRVYVLEFNRKCIFRIYKKYSLELEEKLGSLNTFDIIDSYISYVIKRDGKIALDINLE